MSELVHANDAMNHIAGFIKETTHPHPGSSHIVPKDTSITSSRILHDMNSYSTRSATSTAQSDRSNDKIHNSESEKEHSNNYNESRKYTSKHFLIKRGE